MRWLAATPALSKRESTEAASEYLNATKTLSADKQQARQWQSSDLRGLPQADLTGSNGSGVGNHILTYTHAGEERQGPLPAMLPGARAQDLGSIVGHILNVIRKGMAA